MRRLLTVVAVMAVLLIGAPWVIGNIAEERVNRGLDALVEAAPYLGIVERKYTQGWFRSQQDVTFELVGGAARPLGAAQRFVVRNEILHGPVLGLSGLGLARVNSTLVLDPELRRQIAARFGTEQPLRVSTRVGFLGGCTTTISSDAREMIAANGDAIAWDDLVIDVRWSANLDSIGVKGDWPRFEARNAKREVLMRIDDLVLDVDSQRVKGHLYATDGEFRVDALTYASPGVAPTTIKDLKFVVDTTDDGDFMSVATRLGTGALSGGVLAEQNVALTAVHYDFTVRRLHTETLARITNAMADAYRHPGAVSMVPGYMLDLLKHDPELMVDRVGIETKNGAAHLEGVLRLKGVTEKDLKMGALSLIARLDADLRFEAPQTVVESLPGGREAMTGAVDAGYAELKGGEVMSHLEFHAGQLEINGKAQGIPELGPAFPKEAATAPE